MDLSATAVRAISAFQKRSPGVLQLTVYRRLGSGADRALRRAANWRSASPGARGRSGLITIDRRRRELRLYERERLVRVYRVGVGGIGCRTPAGAFAIQNKVVDPSWTVPANRLMYGDRAGTVVAAGAPENRIRARWMGVDGAIGIHGNPTLRLGIGSSHGCITMAEDDIVDLFGRVDVGTPVLIA